MQKYLAKLLNQFSILLILLCMGQCALNKHPLSTEETGVSIVGSWKQVEPVSECPVYFTFSPEETEFPWAANYTMSGDCDYRKVKRVWTCFECDNTERYREYRNSHYSIDSNLIYFPYGIQDTIKEEVIELISSSPTTLKLEIYNQSSKEFDTLTFEKIVRDSVPSGVQRCECEYRSD